MKIKIAVAADGEVTGSAYFVQTERAQVLVDAGMFQGGKVRANVWTLGGFSAHAGQSDLLKWFTQLAPSWPRVIITHGEDAPRKSLCASIQQQFSLTPELPLQGDVIEISRARAASDALAS
jgi:predicted metal-dependent RNase